MSNLNSVTKTRMTKELKDLLSNPIPEISCWNSNDSLTLLFAQLSGPQGSPYENGLFMLKIIITEKYPFEPPVITFQTPIYHPNIDSTGRICLDTLKMPPHGTWKPAIHIGPLLNMIRMLLSEPNPDDPLMVEIANEFKSNYSEFERKAREKTKDFAMGNVVKFDDVGDSVGVGKEKSNSVDGGSSKGSLNAIEVAESDRNENVGDKVLELFKTESDSPVSTSKSPSVSRPSDTNKESDTNSSTADPIQSQLSPLPPTKKSKWKKRTGPTLSQATEKKTNTAKDP